MRKIYLFLALSLSMACSLLGQNVQLHYDFGRQLYSQDQAERPNLTSTVEMFRPDKWGNTFFFIDMNYQTAGITSAYWEISREFKLGKSPLLLHVEFDGGLSNQTSFNNAYLAGFTYAYNNANYRAGFTFTPMYKYLAKQEQPHSYQLTATWYYHFAGGLLSFCGFADLWGDRRWDNGKNITVFLTEPQLWFNLNKLRGIDPKMNLSIGTEVEVSHNFAVLGKSIINPTLAIKWTF